MKNTRLEDARRRRRRSLALAGSCSPTLALALAGRGRILVDHQREARRPRYGWHGDCAEADPFGPLGTAGASLPLAKLRNILVERGPGRVIERRSRW